MAAGEQDKQKVCILNDALGHEGARKIDALLLRPDMKYALSSGNVKKDIGQEGGKNERRAVGIDIDDAPDGGGAPRSRRWPCGPLWGITFMKN